MTEWPIAGFRVIGLLTLQRFSISGVIVRGASRRPVSGGIFPRRAWSVCVEPKDNNI
jgi:hypothetical protein